MLVSHYKLYHLIGYKNVSSCACSTESLRQYIASNDLYMLCLFDVKTRPVITIYLSNVLSPENISVKDSNV
jgi:hypothetical protein